MVLGSAYRGWRIRRVIIAEDDLDTRYIIRLALRPLECEIVEASSGLELLEALAHQGSFDLIITDLAMPYIDGVRVVAMARTANLRTPVLLVTAYPPDDMATVQWLGDVWLLRKPFALSSLRAAAEGLMAR